VDLRGDVARSRGAVRARAPGHVDRGHLAVVELDDGVARRHPAGPRGADAVLERAGEVAPEAEELVLLALAPGEARVEVEVRRQRRRAAADGPVRGGAATPVTGGSLGAKGGTPARHATPTRRGRQWRWCCSSKTQPSSSVSKCDVSRRGDRRTTCACSVGVRSSSSEVSSSIGVRVVARRLLAAVTKSSPSQFANCTLKSP
jgi:hypothetical protein